MANTNLFSQMTQRLGVLSPNEGLNDISKVTKVVAKDGTQTSPSDLDVVRREAEFMAQDLLTNYVSSSPRRPPNRHCRTLRRTVKELSERHDLVFKGMVNRLKPDENSAFSTFVVVADEIFDDGQVNWGRIVAVYAFAARLAQYHFMNNLSNDNLHRDGNVYFPEKVALFVGKYVANKLGQWILDHGGWDAFIDYFPDQGEFEEKIWKGVLFTAIGLGTLATLVASR